MLRRLLAALAGRPPSDRCRRCPVESAAVQRAAQRRTDSEVALRSAQAWLDGRLSALEWVVQQAEYGGGSEHAVELARAALARKEES